MLHHDTQRHTRFSDDRLLHDMMAIRTYAGYYLGRSASLCASSRGQPK
jgi:hypothetical protein